MKQYRFLDGSMIDVSEDTCRGCYLETADTVPGEIEVIWQNCNFSIRQDAECPVPGFYIVSARQHIHTMVDLSVQQATELGLIIHQLRSCMSEHLNIKRVHMILEEKWVEPHMHVWLLPLWQDVMQRNNIDPKIWNSNILEYIQLFTYDENKMTIRRFNDILKKHLQEDEVLKNLQEGSDA